MNIKIGKVVPVATLFNEKDTAETLSLLSEGGLKTVEITYRTDYAHKAIETAATTFTDVTVGAGTIITPEQCKDAINAGAKFIVSPGLSESVAKVCDENGVPYIPGTITPTEIMRAVSLGLNLLKYFPFAHFGGGNAVKALEGPFPDVKFILTNGITADNFSVLLKIGNVAGVGGSWMLKGSREEKLKKILDITSKI